MTKKTNDPNFAPGIRLVDEESQNVSTGSRMKKIFFITGLCFSLLSAKAGGMHDLFLQQKAGADTSIIKDPAEDSIIAEVLKTKTPPQKEKIQYFSQVTRYGFKNLFAQYNYNPGTALLKPGKNPNAESYMQDYLKVHSNNLLKMKGWGQPYFNLIDNILSQYGLPRELKYLAVIESNLSTGATSWKGAGGPWQFMPYTARDYGLVVNGF